MDTERNPDIEGARELCAHELFERRVERDPLAVALVAGPAAEREIRYGELNAAANRLARYLREHGVRPGDRVGLRMARSGECVAAMLAVLKAGAAYVPLESGFPAARRARIAAECGIRVLLADAELPEDAESALLVLTPSAPGHAGRVAGLSGENLGLALSPELTMYVPFTSGSTGAPKGAEVPHRALPGFFAGEDYAGWGPGRTGLLHSALSWDGHLIDLYPSLLSGGRVVVAPAALRDPVEIAALARRTGVTTLWLSAQAFNTVVDVDPALLDGLSWLVIGGETLSVRHVRTAAEALPDLRIVNGYGPSECTVFSTVHPITAADLFGGGAIPIGRPVGDRRIHLLDEDGEPVPDGEIGELCVGGPAVAHGYLARPRLSAERFVPDPFSGQPGARLYRTGDRARRRPDGRLEFHGRRDGQIKLRGFRIELSEVEAVLRSHPEVADCAAAVHTAGASARLVAYVVPAPGAAAELPDGLAEYARERLHAAMVPGAYVRLDRLPLSRTGKLDRTALPAPDGVDGGTRAPDAGDAPRTATERRLAEVWAELLGLPAIGRLDGFFDRGGDSLLATRVVARARSWVGADTSVADLYQTPVLADFAALLDARAAGAARETGRSADRPALRPRARMTL